MLTSLVVSSLLLGLIALGPAGTQAQGPVPHPSSGSKAAGGELVAVNACVRHVRQFQPAEPFDAHVGLNGQIRPTGNNAAVGRFKDCLQQAGYSME